MHNQEKAMMAAIATGLMMTASFAQDRCNLNDVISNKLSVVDSLSCLAKEMKHQQMPSGAVVAFDSSSLDQDTCPDGWKPFKEARSRMIVGAGDPSQAPGKMGYDENALALKHFILRQHGGEERVALKTTELAGHGHGIVDPQHAHQFLGLKQQDNSSGTYGWLGYKGHYGDAKGKAALSSVTTMPTIGAESHNNMPPYIALYFCKKG